MQVFAQPAFVIIEQLTICRPLLDVDPAYGAINLILLMILLESLKVFLQIGGLARGQVGFDRFPVGVEVLAALLQLLAVIAQGLTILVEIVLSVIDLMKIVPDGMGIGTSVRRGLISGLSQS